MFAGMLDILMTVMRALMKMRKWLYRRPHLAKSIISVHLSQHFIKFIYLFRGSKRVLQKSATPVYVSIHTYILHAIFD